MGALPTLEGASCTVFVAAVRWRQGSCLAVFASGGRLGAACGCVFATLACRQSVDCSTASFGISRSAPSLPCFFLGERLLLKPDCFFRWLASERVPPPQCCRLPTRAHLVRYGMSFDLDDSQHEAWERFLEGKNVGLFGRAGCGTSTVLLRAIAHAQRLHGSEHVVVLAWTNHAANLISGQTLHKFLHVGIADVPKEVVLEQVRSNTFVRDHVKAAKVIFVDELPQFPARWFAVLEFVVRQLALASRQALPWGGTQVVGELVVAWFSTLCLGQ